MARGTTQRDAVRRSIAAGVLLCSLALPAFADTDTANALTNGNAETGDLFGWKRAEGDFQIYDRADKSWPGPPEGNLYFGAGNAGRSVLEQTVSVPPEALLGRAQFSCYLRGGGNDSAWAEVDLLDAKGAVVAAMRSVRLVPPIWTFDQVGVTIPQAAVSARVRLIGVRTKGKFCDGFFDGVALALRPRLENAVDPRTGVSLAETDIARITGIARTSEDDYMVIAASHQLPRFGEKGIATLSSVALLLARQDRPRAAIEVVHVLADGDEPERVAHLKRIHSAVKHPTVKKAVVTAILGAATGTHVGLLANPGAEIIGLRGWERREGAWNSVARKGGGWPGPAEGKRYFAGGVAARSVLEQMVVVPADTTGGVAVLSCSLCATTTDRVSVRFETLDRDGRVIASDASPVLEETPWTAFEFKLPITRVVAALRVRLTGVRKSGKHCNVYADALDLSVRPPIELLADAASGRHLSDLPVAALERIARGNGDDYLALSAARLLSSQKAAGYKALAKVARHRAREGRTDMALATIAILGAGDDDDRRGQLRGVLNTTRDDGIREALILALAGFYPQDSDVVLKRLHSGKGNALPLLHRLDTMGVFDEDLLPCLTQPKIARETYLILRKRAAKVGPEHLGVVAAGYADEAVATSGWRRLLGDWCGREDWDLARALADLMDDGNEERRFGAHMLLLGLTGDDISADRSLWRGRFEGKLEPGPPSASAQGFVAAAELRALRYLKRVVAATGRIDDGRGHWDGATAMAIVALRSSGVPADDPMITKALETSVLGQIGTTGTYQASTMAMALESVDRVKYRPQLEILRDRLVNGQHPAGGWTYTSHPAGFEGKWKRLDMSCTQYAILGLRAIRRAGVEVPRLTWERAEDRVRKRHWTNSGGWSYCHPNGETFSMTAAGVSSLAIVLEALHGRDASKKIAADGTVQKGLRRLGEYLHSSYGYANHSFYVYYGLERACILTGARTFAGFDWYREGVEDLVATQDDSGSWCEPGPRALRGNGYGAALETSWALLFLKRATTPIDGTSQKGAVAVPGFGRQAQSAPHDTAASTEFVRTWRYSDRTRAWIRKSELPKVDASWLRLVTESAKRAPLVTANVDIPNLLHLCGSRASAVSAYAYRKIVCDAPRRIRVLYGSDDSCRVWVNRALMDTFVGIRGTVADSNDFHADLDAGDNDLLLEISQWSGSWNFCVRFESDDGKRLRLGLDGRLTEIVPPPDPPK